MALTMEEKNMSGKRSPCGTSKEKGVMLQEFCATTAYSPPYAAYLLHTYAKRVITLVPTRPSS